MVLIFGVALIGGAIFYYFERSQKKLNEQKIANYVDDIKNAKNHSLEERGQKIEELLQTNGYRLEKREKGYLKFSKKDISIGLLVFYFGFLGVGVLIYLVYFYFFKKMEIKEIHYQ
ncbi:MAG: hypothetical protein ACOCP1_00135 [Campylobacterales bacterium]